MKDERTIAELADEAICVMDACNLSGVVHAWSRSIHRLRELYPDQSTEFYNRHSISVLFAEKVYDLTECGAAFSAVYDKVKRLKGIGQLLHSHRSTHHGNLSHVDCPECQKETRSV